jgi:hypothetical protein
MFARVPYSRLHAGWPLFPYYNICIYVHTSKKALLLSCVNVSLRHDPLKIVNCFYLLPPTVYCKHSSYNPISIARHNQSPSEYSQTTYRYQSNNKGEGEEDAQQGRLSDNRGCFEQ